MRSLLSGGESTKKNCLDWHALREKEREKIKCQPHNSRWTRQWQPFFTHAQSTEHRQARVISLLWLGQHLMVCLHDVYYTHAYSP